MQGLKLELCGMHADSIRTENALVEEKDGSAVLTVEKNTREVTVMIG